MSCRLKAANRFFLDISIGCFARSPLPLDYRKIRFTVCTLFVIHSQAGCSPPARTLKRSASYSVILTLQSLTTHTFILLTSRNGKLFTAYKQKAKKWQGRHHSVPCLFLFLGKMLIKLRPRRRLLEGFWRFVFLPINLYVKCHN